mmetsp:Transcript_34310/g.95754  ORF Transcript_34310/g.95754 Transcript_34310/m.95754 type:complete len:162 (-) Transcript_34310:101-586(-)
MSSITFRADQQSTSTRPPAINPSYAAQPEIVYGDNIQKSQSPNSPNSNNNTNAVVNPHTKRELGGAAVAGGLVGLAIGGPLIAAVAAGGCALAVTSKSQGGKVVRAGGEAVACVGDRLKKINKKHQVVQKTGRGITKGCNWVAKRVKPKDMSPNNASAPIH